MTVVWVVEWVAMMLGFLGDPPETVELPELLIQIMGGAVVSILALVLLVLPLCAVARICVRRYSLHCMMPCAVFVVGSSLLAGIVGAWQMSLEHHFDAVSFWCRFGFVLAGSLVFWFASFRYERMA